MSTVAPFPTVDTSGVTERPLSETLTPHADTPEFNQVLKRPHRTVSVSQLKKAKWPEATTFEPETEPSTEEPDETPAPAPEATPEPATEPDATPEPEQAPVPETDPEPESAPESVQE